METGIKRTLLTLTFVLIASLAYGTVRVGLLPVEMDSSLKRDARASLLERTITQEVFGMLEETLQSTQFSLLFGKEDPAYSFEALYEQQPLMDASQLFTLDSQVMRQYLLSRYTLDVLLQCRISSLDSFTILDIYSYGLDDASERIYTQMIDSRTLSFDQKGAFRAIVAALEQRELVEVSIDKEDSDLWLSIGGMDTPLSSRDSLFFIVPKETVTIRILYAGSLIDTLSYDLRDYSDELVLPRLAFTPQQYEEIIVTDPGNRIIYQDTVTSLPLLSIEYQRDAMIALQLRSDTAQRTFLIEPEGGKVHYLTLSPFETTVKRSQDTADQFYTSLSLTILSLPLTILSRFMYDQTGIHWLKAVSMATNGVTAVLALSTVSQVLRYYDSVN